MANQEAKKRAFGEWLARTRGERAQLGLPTSQAGMARHLEVADRTLRRWKDDDPVVAQAYSARLAERLPEEEPEPEASGGDVVSSEALDESTSLNPEFAEIRRALVEDAKRGGKGLEVYMRHIGKYELEAQRRAQESGFTDLTDQELVDKCLSLIGREAVEEWLKGTQDA